MQCGCPGTDGNTFGGVDERRILVFKRGDFGTGGEMAGS